ncbi:hypothetical protein MLD38_013158 [Melastoma candidum]|uniref:Uncharacterized protein n=1 Tax=Melastoma candidum TaxID=119954 RepID=A0ACB9R8M2_9MYRT|nr:hypothetical protein MLD38_013158 [Melastoma candidum]
MASSEHKTAEQGDCSKFKATTVPHWCKKDPTVVDLLPSTRYNNQFANCCKGRVAGRRGSGPLSISLGFPGHCWTGRHLKQDSEAAQELQVTGSWTGVHVQPCQGRALIHVPHHLSPQQASGSQDVPLFPVPHEEESELLCPFLLSTMTQSRVAPTAHVVARTITTCLKYVKIGKSLQKNSVFDIRFRINALRLPSPRTVSTHKSDTWMFSGMTYYNDMLMQAGPSGNVQLEVLVKKDKNTFTFKKGRAFPRRVYVNGEECLLPPPDTFPYLSNSQPWRHPLFC